MSFVLCGLETAALSSKPTMKSLRQTHAIWAHGSPHADLCSTPRRTSPRREGSATLLELTHAELRCLLLLLLDAIADDPALPRKSTSKETRSR